MFYNAEDEFKDFYDGAVGRSVRVFPYDGRYYTSCVAYDNGWFDCSDQINDKGYVFVNDVSNDGRGGNWVLKGIWHDDSNFNSIGVEVEFAPSDADAVLQFIG